VYDGGPPERRNSGPKRAFRFAFYRRKRDRVYDPAVSGFVRTNKLPERQSLTSGNARPGKLVQETFCFSFYSYKSTCSAVFNWCDGQLNRNFHCHCTVIQNTNDVLIEFALNRLMKNRYRIICPVLYLDENRFILF